MSLRTRLKRLERLRPPGTTLWAVFIDEAGRIMDDGSVIMRPWVGRRLSELPAEIKVGKVIGGVDPLVVFGHKRSNDASPIE